MGCFLTIRNMVTCERGALSICKCVEAMVSKFLPSHDGLYLQVLHWHYLKLPSLDFLSLLNEKVVTSLQVPGWSKTDGSLGPRCQGIWRCWIIFELTTISKLCFAVIGIVGRVSGDYLPGCYGRWYLPLCWEGIKPQYYNIYQINEYSLWHVAVRKSCHNDSRLIDDSKSTFDFSNVFWICFDVNYKIQWMSLYCFKLFLHIVPQILLVNTADCSSWESACCWICLMVINMVPKKAVARNDRLSTNMMPVVRQTILFFIARLLGTKHDKFYQIWLCSCDLSIYFL